MGYITQGPVKLALADWYCTTHVRRKGAHVFLKWQHLLFLNASEAQHMYWAHLISRIKLCNKTAHNLRKALATHFLQLQKGGG